LFGNGYPGSTNHIIVAALELQRSITDAEVANIPELFWDVFDAGRLTVPVVSPAGYAHPTLSAVTGLNVTASSFRPSVTYTF
jgi:hypothetical protein